MSRTIWTQRISTQLQRTAPVSPTHIKARPRHDIAVQSQRGGNGPLKGVKILDLTRVLAVWMLHVPKRLLGLTCNQGPFCTQILADYGAEVIKVEHPTGGDDTRTWRTQKENRLWNEKGKSMSAYFSTINRNKKSISLNLKHEKGRKIFFELAEKADVVVDNFIPGKMDELGIGYDVLRYGSSGPYAKRAGYDVIAAGEAGLLHITGEPNGPPTKPGVGLTDMCTGLYLHGAILAALYTRQQTGVGQKVDASLFETQVSVLANVAMTWLNTGEEAKRWGTSHPSIVPYQAFKTKDSYLVLGAVNNRQFKILTERLGLPELPEDARFVDNDTRVLNREVLKPILDEAFAARSTDDWLAIFEGSGMPYGPINTLQKAFEHPQIEARRMVEIVPHEAAASGSIKILGIPVKYSNTKPSIHSPPPLLGEHTDVVLQELGYSGQAISELRTEKAV
ncbi:hypothetical protein LTR13_009247 [Exophiala sideris]|uniref:Uncharacterized protein n=1 Tax=Exophiala sideris TaxID=1016849 RepID=A0ABR0IYI7_9EURO|nr:hypothetical protein LTR13_009247 [Exophiala sideris]KAK5051760.1 hypothetical protein LTR69_010051 [Exophiala sideris]